MATGEAETLSYTDTDTGEVRTLATWKSSLKEVFDEKAFQKEFPETWMKYGKPETTVTLDRKSLEKDSLKNIAEKVVVNKNFSLTGVRFNIATKRHPMPYDPANFTFGYAYSTRNTTGETTAWEKDQNWKYSFNYSWSPNLAPFEPFKKSKSKSKWFKILRDQTFNFLPQNIRSSFLYFL